MISRSSSGPAFRPTWTRNLQGCNLLFRSVNGAASDFKTGLLVYNTPYARKQYYLHEQGTDLHGAKGETERHRGSYWGQRAIADHKDELEKFAHDAAKQILGENK